MTDEEIKAGVKCTLDKPDKLANIHNDAVDLCRTGDIVSFYCPLCGIYFNVDLTKLIWK
jgi:hypothetical protein